MQNPNKSRLIWRVRLCFYAIKTSFVFLKYALRYAYYGEMFDWRIDGFFTQEQQSKIKRAYMVMNQETRGKAI